MTTAIAYSERDTLTSGADALGVALDAAMLDRLSHYLDLLVKWNRVHNLTAVRERTEMVTLHLLDSLAVLPHLAPGRLIDVGAGAGLPGIPIAIAAPTRAVCVLDSNQKKTAFLRQVGAELGLANLDVVSERAEVYRPQRAFDLAIARAYADLAGFAAACTHLLRPGGEMVAMKGLHPREEIARLPTAVRVLRIVPLEIPGLAAARHLIVMDRHE